MQVVGVDGDTAGVVANFAVVSPLPMRQIGTDYSVSSDEAG
jgi:hypothetical protein